MTPRKKQQLWKKVKGELEAKLCQCTRSVSDRTREIRDESTHHEAHALDEPTGVDGDVQAQLAQISEAECEEIKKALARGNAGLYAVCVSCEGDIGEGRLKVLPYTTRCIRCVSGGTDLPDAEDETERAFA